VKYACIRAHRRQFPVTVMCRLLGVSRAGYYAAQQRGHSAHATTDARLALHIRSIYRHSRGTYGSPRIHAELVAAGVRCGRKRVARLMRAAGLQARPRRHTRTTTQSHHGHPVAPNQLNRAFRVDQIAALNHVWAGDITYLPTREGWLYLAVILDLKSRMVVGWAMLATIDGELTCRALRMALARRGAPTSLLHHSDRGVQYAATAYQQLLRHNQITPSMSRRGNCYDNAVVESFFATLEWELGSTADWPTRAAAQRAVFEYIEVWYNRQRRHSSLGFVSPLAYERHLVAAVAAG
jgi:transposase InsO family protein